ncbi:hypothetical protein GPECTOR_108g190 [Gonium pectorale]|uniref:Threonylcarbamoyl-AMP synthase n=1 Tax=Gonium pectorale TaxID=33097 RepID=A0A150G0M8_GONPE|nr:hypothetical protein GPECTOR_108g190 [Gonium pectorale]|eukprot:KXZ42995.1 hypothetical protein GPECTOR_108g190 [Gonium pectorale]
MQTEVAVVDAAELRGGEASTSGRDEAPRRHPVIARAAALLAAGEVVAIPTETVYGLAANALSASAVSKIYAAKNRPADNPLIVHVSSLAMLASLYPPGWSLPAIYTAAVAELWPGPLTILLPRSPLVPDAVTCGMPTMAVRMPAHPLALALIAACGFPLAAPSANSSGRPSPTLARHVLSDLDGRIPLVLDGGPCTCGLESTVLDGLRSPPAILRPGGVTAERLASYPGLSGLQVYRRDFVDAALEAAPTTPGMKYRHYSPSAPVLLLDPGDARPAGGTASGADSGAAGSGDGSTGMNFSASAAAEDDACLAARLRSAAAALLAELAAERSAAAATATTTAAVEGTAGREGTAPSGRWTVGVLRTTVAGAPSGPLPSQPSAISGCGTAPADAPPAALGGVAVMEYVLGHVSRPEAVASELFAGLRHMDELGVGAIVVEGVRDAGAGTAVMNRLRKAASRVVRV